MKKIDIITQTTLIASFVGSIFIYVILSLLAMSLWFSPFGIVLGIKLFQAYDKFAFVVKLIYLFILIWQFASAVSRFFIQKERTVLIWIYFGMFLLLSFIFFLKIMDLISDNKGITILISLILMIYYYIITVIYQIKNKL